MPETWAIIEAKICQDWNQEQISGWMKRNLAMEIMLEWIYQYIYQDKRTNGNLHKHLGCRRKRRKRYGKDCDLPGTYSLCQRKLEIMHQNWC